MFSKSGFYALIGSLAAHLVQRLPDCYACLVHVGHTRRNPAALRCCGADYFLYTVSGSSEKSRSKQNITNLAMVLKDENLFAKFEKQARSEFSVENLNFLVSCILYLLSVIRQGNFGIRSSDTEADDEIFTMLRQDGMADEDEDPKKIARFIYREFCVQGAPQEINLEEQLFKKLSVRFKNISNVYSFVEKDVFGEAFDFIYDILDSDPILRFQTKLSSTRGIQCNSYSTDGRGHRMPLLAEEVQ